MDLWGNARTNALDHDQLTSLSMKVRISLRLSQSLINFFYTLFFISKYFWNMLHVNIKACLIVSLIYEMSFHKAEHKIFIIRIYSRDAHNASLTVNWK